VYSYIYQMNQSFLSGLEGIFDRIGMCQKRVILRRWKCCENSGEGFGAWLKLDLGGRWMGAVGEEAKCSL
jgi:hypothetical protein